MFNLTSVEIIVKFCLTAKGGKLCKEYGTNFGGWCIEEQKFKEILQNEGKQLFENLKE